MKALIFSYREFQGRAQNNYRSILADGYTTSALPSLKNVVWAGSNGIRVPGLLYLLQTCARMGLLFEGMCCHGLVIQAGLQTQILTSNMLINMYSKCGCVNMARLVFDRMPMRSIVSWNTILSAYAQHGEHESALKLFVEMHHGGTSLSEFTLSSVLCACAAKSAVVECKQLHAVTLKTAMDSNVFVGTAVLDVYTKCNMMKEAHSVFIHMPEKSAVTWSSMVAGFVQNDLYEEALTLFLRTQRLDLERTQFTFSAALSACASLAAITEGSQLHAVLARSGLDKDLFVATSLIDVYSRCGCIEEAYIVFKNVDEGNIVVWNAMIAGFSRHARPTEALILFEKMQQIGMHPNEVTYISALSACSHVGWVEKGRDVFSVLMRDSCVQPNVFHYSCMVDVLGRAGLVHEAWDLICGMPFKATASMWGSLLGSCKTHGHLDVAKIAAEHLFEIEPDNAGNHVLLSNLYAANKRWEEVSKTRKLLKESGTKKELGKSWIKVKNKVHVFVVGEGNHPRIAEVYAKLEDLESEMKKLAYKSKTECDLHDVGEEEKEMLLKHHSEKLALAFGLISLPPGIPIRIFKNLRVCGDCHSVMKFASRITGREIILRDTNRFHHFRYGSCSCRDFW